jgi:hypothetical protein
MTQIKIKPKLATPFKRGFADFKRDTLESMSSSWPHLTPLVVLMGIYIFWLVACGNKKPVRIGFVAQLTGVQPENGGGRATGGWSGP